MPIQDTEDAHVLETAIAGQAQILITANFKDFIAKDTLVLVPQQHAIHTTPGHALHIVHPFRFMEWIKSDSLPEK